MPTPKTIPAGALLALAALLQGCVMPPPPPPPHAGGPPPPPEFATACEGRPEGSALQLTGRRGEMLDGRCRRAPDGRLVFMPAPPR